MRLTDYVARPLRRVTLFAGHYGSGKTNLAVNFALALSALGHPVTVADMDIVNPYFRTKDSAEALAAAGIDLISPAYANTNLDLPALPAALYEVVARRDRHAVLDIGGDDRGAYALGRYTPSLLEEGNFEMVFVANFCRPLTRTAEDAAAVMAEIQAAGGLPFTAIVNNSNLGKLTTPETLRATYPLAEALSRMTGLPILMNAAEAGVAAQMEEGEAFPLTLQKKYFDIEGE